MNVIRFPFWILLVAFVCAVGCATQKPAPNPLAGWKFCFSQNPIRSNQTILDDYQDYIKNLPSKERGFGGNSIDLFEDGTGQHAVKIEIPINGTYWEHILIYNKDDKRSKVIKYSGGHYRS